MKAPAEPGNERFAALTALPGSPLNSMTRRTAWIALYCWTRQCTNIAYVPYVSNVRYIRADQDMINVSYRAPMPDDVINPYADEPLYVQLAGIVRRKIQSGELKHLDPVPSESSLGQDYGVSRDTVRRAVALLRDEGIVFTVPHRGTYVGPRPK